MDPTHSLVVTQVSSTPSHGKLHAGVRLLYSVALTRMLATENLNQWFSSGDQAYIIVASAMVVTMVPGLGFLYSGLARRKSALSMIFACMGSFAVITFQWYFWGYSLAFSAQGKSGFIGDLTHFGLRNTLGAPSPGSPLIPELLYSFYQACSSHIMQVYGNADGYRSCNSVLLLLPLSPEPSLSEGVYCQ